VVLQPRENRRKPQVCREDREGTVLTAIMTSIFRDLPQDNRSLPPTKIFAEPKSIGKVVLVTGVHQWSTGSNPHSTYFHPFLSASFHSFFDEKRLIRWRRQICRRAAVSTGIRMCIVWRISFGFSHVFSRYGTTRRVWGLKSRVKHIHNQYCRTAVITTFIIVRLSQQFS